MPDQIIGTGVDGTTDPIGMYQEGDVDEEVNESGQRSQFEAMVPFLAAVEEGFARKAAEVTVTFEPIDRPDQDRSDEDYGTPSTITLPKYNPDFSDFRQHFEVQPTSGPAESSQEPGSEPVGEIDLEDVDQVYGISFPKAMLPLGASFGTWEAEPILDMDGNEEAALVRVWLYPPEGRS